MWEASYGRGYEDGNGEVGGADGGERKMKAMMKAKSLKVLIEATKKFLAISSRKPCHQYIRLEFDSERHTVAAVGVDGCRLSVEHSIAEYIDESFVAYIKPSIPKFKKEDTAIIELTDKRCTIQIGDTITGYLQPVDEYLDYKNTLDEIEKNPVQYRICLLYTSRCV